MKRPVLWIVAAGIASAALVFALRAQEKTAQAPTPQESSPTTPEGDVTFTFSDDAQMQEFAKLWQQRQGMIARMAVLQSYWNQEQATLGQINQQLLSQYNLDVSKNYTLDTEHKALIEREAPPEQPTQADQATTAAPPAAASSP